MTTPHVITMKLSDLEAAPYNPRKIADKALAGYRAGFNS